METKQNIKKWTIVIAVIVASISVGYGLGYWAKKPEIQTKIETKIEEKIVEKIVERKVYIKDKTQTETKITKPDGTVIQTTTRNDVEVASNSTQKETQAEIKKEENINQKTTITELPKYSIGLRGEVDLGWQTFKEKPIISPEITAGYRILGPIWIEGSYNIDKHDAGVGVRWER